MVGGEGKMRMRVSGFVFSLQAILSFCPHLTLGCDGVPSSAHVYPPALVGRGMLFIQFGAGGRGGKVFLIPIPTSSWLSKQDCRGHKGSSVNLLTLA